MPTCTTRPWVNCSAARGAKRSVTTTSAAASKSRARRVSRSGSPGPAPTSATRPAWGRCARRSAVMSASRTVVSTAVARRGSAPPDTAICTSPAVAVAADHAAPPESEALTHQMPAACAAAATRRLTSGVAQACTNQAPRRSSSANGRLCTSQGKSSAACGATTVTTAPSANRPCTRRAATGPAPTTSTGFPVRRRNSGYTPSMVGGRSGSLFSDSSPGPAPAFRCRRRLPGPRHDRLLLRGSHLRMTLAARLPGAQN